MLKGILHPPIISHPGAEYGPSARNYQGIPGIEHTAGGRLWATWYAGKVWEERFNYAVAATSGDNGKTWTDVSFVIDPDGDGPLRACDSCLWLDPDGKLWLFWWLNEKVWSGTDETKLSVTMAMTTANPDAEKPDWSKPLPLFTGVMLNKPIVTSWGDWLAPVAIWGSDKSCRVMVSKNKGASWEPRGAATGKGIEHMIVERKDKTLWMLARTGYGIGESTSNDRGKTWTDLKDYQRHAVSRFHIGRLRSGNLLLIRHGAINEKSERDRLTAYLSDDDGRKWKGGLLLDERSRTSYPDATQAADGTIHAIYDYSRHLEKQILMATFTEEDVLAGRLTSSVGRVKVLVNQATGENPCVGRLGKGPALRTDSAAAAIAAGKPGAKLRCEVGEIRPLERCADVFSDGDYIVRHLPKAPGKLFDRNRQFIFAPKGQTRAVCVAPGMAYVFTPTPDRNTESVAGELLARGFVKTSVEEFDFIFKTNEKARTENVCSVYQKELKAGETVAFGKWGVLVF